MNAPTIITDCTVEPVTLTEAKAHCRIDTSDTEQDALILSYISAARDFVEWKCGITVYQKTLEVALSDFPSCGYIALPAATPAIEVVSVKYTDTDEQEQTWSADEYVVSLGSDRRCGRVAPKFGLSWPSGPFSPLDPVKVRYTAGIAVTDGDYATANPIVRRAVLELVARMFEIREAEVLTDRATVEAVAMQYGLDALFSRLRVEYAF